MEGTTAPEALAEAPAPVEAPATLPATDDLPAAPADPLQPGALVTEGAPEVTDLPVPPPLTPEEEALLRQLAEGSPGNPEAALPEAAPAPETPAPAETEAPQEAPAEATQDAVEPQLPADAPLPEVATEDVTLIEPDPSLPSAAGLPGEPGSVTTDRLPRIGGTGDATGDAPAATGTPLQDHARPFDNPTRSRSSPSC